MLSKERLQVSFKSAHPIISFLAALEPIRDLHIALPEALIEKNYHTIIVNMPNDSTDRLVYSALCLQGIPALAIHCALTGPELPIEEVLLDQNFGVEHLRIWYTGHNDSASCIIGEVDSFG